MPGRDSGGEQGTKTKQTRAITYNMRRARKATIYIYKWCKTAQIGGQSKDTGVFAQIQIWYQQFEVRDRSGPYRHMFQTQECIVMYIFVMYRGSAADFLVVLCKPGNPTAKATEGAYTHLDNFLRLRLLTRFIFPRNLTDFSEIS